METTSVFSSSRPPPPPPSPPPRFGDNRPNFEPFEQQHVEEPPQYMTYYQPPPEPEPEKSFMDTISKKVLFVIFLAFIVGLFIGKFMSQSTIVVSSKHI